MQAAVPLTKLYEYALFFGQIDLFLPIPRRASQFNVYKDDRFVWELNQLYGKDIGEVSDFRSIFDDLVKKSVIQCPPNESPILDVILAEQSDELSEFDVFVWLPPDGFDPFGHPYIERGLKPYSLPSFEKLLTYGKELLTQLATHLSTESKFSIQSNPGALQLEIEPVGAGKLKVRTNILARNTDSGLYHRDEFTDDAAAHLYQIYYLIAELLRVVVSNRAQANTIAPSLGLRQISFRTWEPDDVPPDTDAEKQMSQFFVLRAGEHPDVRTALSSGKISATELRRIFDASHKWKQWINSIGNDQSLAQAYLSSLEKEPTLNKMPLKVLRCVGMTGVGIAALFLNPVAGAILTVGGLAYGAVDMLLLERVVTDYNPKVFWSQMKTKTAK